MPSITRTDIRQAVRELGLSGRAVCIHASFRSFGRQTDGPDSLIDAFVDERCTVLVPSFTWSFAVPPPSTGRYQRNGWDYAKFAGPTNGVGRIYTPASAEIDRDMGVVAAAVVARAGRARGIHPLCSFSALGPVATKLIDEQQPLNVYGPLEALASRGGYVLLLGVGLRSLTLLHLAEQRAGRALFRRWANDASGRPVAVEVGGCSAGFQKLEPRIGCAAKSLQVGQSGWTAWPAMTVLEDAGGAIRAEPRITHCDMPECGRCNDAVMGGPILYL